MTFGSPGWLLGLLVLPAVVAAYVWSQGRRRRRLAALAAGGLVLTDGARSRRWRRQLPFALFMGALALLVVACARPMTTIKTPRRVATVVLCMDVSNSMAATDVKPSRLGAAKLAAEDFVRQQSGNVRMGVVAFGPTAVIVQSPTLDHADVLSALSHLSLGGGTSLGAGILSSLDAIAGKPISVNLAALAQDNSGQINIGYYGGDTIVVFSDGEDTTQTNPVTMARVASTAGVRIQTVGVGTTAGTTVEIDGFSVATAMDPQTLRSVAQVTNGSYHQVDDPTAVRAISRTIDLHFTILTQYTEVTALFTGAAVVLLVVGALASVLWWGRVLT